MREGNESEYGRLTSIPNAMKRIMTTKGSQVISWQYCSVIVAEKVIVFKRGKQISCHYSVNQLFLDNDAKVAYDMHLVAGGAR